MARPRVRLGDLSVGFVQPLAEAVRALGVKEAVVYDIIGLFNKSDVDARL